MESSSGRIEFLALGRGVSERVSRNAGGHALWPLWCWQCATTREEGWCTENKRHEGTIKRPSDVHQYRGGPAETFHRDCTRFCTRPAKISDRQYRTMLDCRHYGGHCRGLDMSPVASGIQAAISWPSLPLGPFPFASLPFAELQARQRTPRLVSPRSARFSCNERIVSTRKRFSEAPRDWSFYGRSGKRRIFLVTFRFKRSRFVQG